MLPRHRVARENWCRQHLRWTAKQWANVLFTDESRFTVSFNDGRVRVWRRPGERFVDATVRQGDRYGGGSVMMWGGISSYHRTPPAPHSRESDRPTLQGRSSYPCSTTNPARHWSRRCSAGRQCSPTSCPRRQQFSPAAADCPNAMASQFTRPLTH